MQSTKLQFVSGPLQPHDLLITTAAVHYPSQNRRKNNWGAPLHFVLIN